MSKVVKTEAIVFKKTSLLNKDLRITLLTKEWGKINVFAKGAKKITSRRLPHLETANLINAFISKKEIYFYLQETELISGFIKIKKEPKKMSYLYFIFFVLEKILPENEKEPKIYQLTKSFLVDLSQKDFFNKETMTDYLNQFLKILGYIKKKIDFEELCLQIEEIINQKLPFFLTS
ncbi:MAG: DNA repair protein RecO [Patescibacteria group bacterium]|nr:DNA repair protein RecO [Patescibacteria group bacterium]